MWRCSNQRARITPATRLSANHCAHDRWWSHTRVSGSVDSPSKATPGPTASTRPGRASFIVSRKTPSAPRSRTSPAMTASCPRSSSARRLPRVVAEEDPHARAWRVADELRQVGHVAVVVELAAPVDPLHRIRVPEHDAVEPAERLTVGRSVGREAPGGVVVEPLVPEPRERDREATLRPRELGPLVGAAVVVDAAAASSRQRASAARQAGQSAGASGRGEDLRAVERFERPVERHGARQVDRPRDKRVARRSTGGSRVGAARRRPRACAAPARRSCSRRSPAASSRCVPQRRRPPLVDPGGAERAPRTEPTAAPFVSVSQPPCTTAPIPPEKSPSKA